MTKADVFRRPSLLSETPGYPKGGGLMKFYHTLYCVAVDNLNVRVDP